MRNQTPRDSIVLSLLEELDSERPRFTAGSQRLANRIRESPEYDIDMMVLTDKDEDHLPSSYTIHERAHVWIVKAYDTKKGDFDISEEKELEVPSIASMIACILVSRTESDSILGDLEEKYRNHSERHGARFAKIWYWWQVGSLIGPWVRSVLFWIGGLAGLKKALDWIGKLGGS